MILSRHAEQQGAYANTPHPQHVAMHMPYPMSSGAAKFHVMKGDVVKYSGYRLSCMSDNKAAPVQRVRCKTPAVTQCVSCVDLKQTWK